LRHTFARRLAEQEMPIESLAKLLGHAQVQTTQLYTAGADPHLRDAFAQAMAQLEERPPSAPLVPEPMPHPQPEQAPRTAERRADPAQLAACLTPFDPLPSWLRDLLRAYLTWRWRNWQPHMARRHGERLAHLLSRSWEWLLTHHQLEGWADLQRSTLEAWLHARTEAGLAASTRTSELSEMLSFLRFVADQGVPLTANLFRVSYPEKPEALPRYLSEDEYRRLEQTVLAQTADDPQDPAKTQVNVRDHAWFFTLAHTGLRVSELLNLRLGDLDLAGGRLIVRSGKNTQDRLVYLTPTLIAAFHRYLPQRPSLADDHLWLDGDRPLQDHQVRHRLRCWGKSCAVAVTPHRLRHTLATRLINHGMPLESLRQLLGHQHLNMTQHYARIYDATVRDHFQAAMARMEGIAVSNWPRRETVLTTAQPEPV
jgi:integrase/recombinase XerD